MEIGKNNNQNLINAFREANPELKKLSDEEILSVMAQTSDIRPDVEGVSLFSDGKIQSSEVSSVKGVALEHNINDNNADNTTQNTIEANSKDFEFAQQQAAVSQFSDDAKAGMELYHLAMDNSGAISKGWNEVKKAFNGELASDKVYRKLVCVQTTSLLLDKVKGDEKISAYDFVQTKMDELLSLIGSVTEEERTQFEMVFLYEQAINLGKNAPGGSLSQMINLLTDFEPDPNSPIDPLAQYENVTKMVKDKLKESYQKYSDTNKISKSDSISGSLRPDFNDAVLAQKDSLKKQLLDFNDVFYFERGIEFKPENIEAYYKKDFEVKLRTQVDLQLRDYRQILDGIANKRERQARQTQVPEISNPNFFAEVDERDRKELTQIIKALLKDETEYKKYGIELDENGILKSTSERIEPDGTKVYYSIDEEDIALKLLQLVDKKIDANLNGKTLEDYNNELEEAYNNAYGKFAKPVELAERFKQSQEGAVETAKTVVMVGGIAISLFSGGTAAPLVAMGIATLGPTSLTALEARTDKNGVTPEEREAIKDELEMAIVFLPVGMGIGSTSAKLGMKAMGSMAQKVGNSSSKFAKFLPKLTRAVSEYGSDAIMSTAADAVIMGDVSLSGETFNEVMNIFTNAVSRGKMRRLHMKKNNTAQLPNPKPDLTSSEVRLLGQSTDNTKPQLANENSVQSSNAQTNKVASVSEPKQETRAIDGKVLLQKPEGEWFGIVHDNYHGFDGFNELNNTFDSSMNPITMENVPPQKGTKIIHIDNFKKPGGTIAVSGTLDEFIATDRLRDCAGMVVVDRKHNLQTLIHCWPDENINFNEDIISYILSHSDSKDLEISIIPGILSETSDTVAFLSDMVTKYASESSLKYCNFPDTDGFKVDGHPRSGNLTDMNNEMEHRINQADKRAVVLHDGEVTCCLNTELETGNKIVNPKDRIIYAEMPADNKNVRKVKLLSAENIAQTRDMIAELPYIAQFKESDVEYYNSCIDDIFEAVCKNSNGDIELIHSRINNLDKTICTDYIFGERPENIDVILDNIGVIKEVKENVKRKMYWNTFDMISGITKENLPKVLEASRKAKDGDVEALRYLYYVQYSRTTHDVVYGNTNVNVDTRIILKLITARNEMDGAYFNHEISRLFTEYVDMQEKKAYGKSFAGVLEQHPELLDIAEKTYNMTSDEYENYVNSLIKQGKLGVKLQFRTFKPDSRTIEAKTAVGAYLYMRDKGIKKFSQASVSNGSEIKPQKSYSKKLTTSDKPASDIPAWSYNDPRYGDIDAVSEHLAQKLEAQGGALNKNDIQQMVNRISSETNCSEKEVLEVMQRITQFGSFYQLESLGKKLKKLGIDNFYVNDLTDQSYIYDTRISLNTVFRYIANQKGQIPLDNSGFGKKAFILDDAGLNYINEIKTSHPDKFRHFKDELDRGQLILVNLDGTNIKIGDKFYSYTAFDGSANLEELTKQVLKQKQNGSLDNVVNSGINERVSELLGADYADKIENIKLDNKLTASRVAEQVRPDFSDRDMIARTIETIVNDKMAGCSSRDQEIGIQVLGKYYDHMFKYYSINTETQILKKRHQQIQDKVSELGKTMDDVVYYTPCSGKSFDFVKYLYAKANDIPLEKMDGDSRFINSEDMDGMPVLDNVSGKVLVILDDVVGSGMSFVDSFDYNKFIAQYPNSNVLFVPINCANLGYAHINKNINYQGDRHDLNNFVNEGTVIDRRGKDFLIYEEDELPDLTAFYNSLTPEERKIFSMLNFYTGFNQSNIGIAFQYMVPDNVNEVSGYLGFQMLNDPSNSSAFKPIYMSNGDDYAHNIINHIAGRKILGDN